MRGEEYVGVWRVERGGVGGKEDLGLGGERRKRGRK